MPLILTIAGGIVLGTVGVLLVLEWTQRRLRRGGSIAGGIAQLALWAFLICLLVGGALYQWSREETARTERAYATEANRQADSARADANLFAKLDHEMWCDTWSGGYVSDSACARWMIDTLPPPELGETVRRFARSRLADTLAAASEIAFLDREISGLKLEPADILPLWNRWAASHLQSDHFGRYQAAALVRKRCGLGQRNFSDIDANLRAMNGWTEWCFRSEYTDSVVFSGSAIDAAHHRDTPHYNDAPSATPARAQPTCASRTSDPHWRVVSGPCRDPAVAIDATRFGRTASMVDGWVAFNYARPRPVGRGDTLVVQAVAHVIADCSAKRIATLASTTYDASSNVVASGSFPYPSDAGAAWVAAAGQETDADLTLIGLCGK